MYTDEQIIKALEAKAPHDEVAREALRVINHKDSLLYAAKFAFGEIYKQLQKANHNLKRYGRRIREQMEEIADLNVKLDGAIAGQETLQRALAKCEFDYGIVVFKHRFSLNRSLDDYKETTLSKCIRMGIEYKYKTMARDELIAEMQIVYKDENDKLQCLCEDLHEYTFEIKHKGDMRIVL